MNIKKINELEFVEKAEGLYSVCSDADGNTKRYKISASQGGDCPFEKGESENSAVLKGGNNQVISEGSVALGKDNIVGLKGFYYKNVKSYAANPKLYHIYVSKTQTIPQLDVSNVILEKDIDLKQYYEVGDILTIINDTKYENCCKLRSFLSLNGLGVIQIELITDRNPFKDGIVNMAESDIDIEDFSIYCVNKPFNGISVLSHSCFAGGHNNIVSSAGSFACGKNNNAFGKFSFAVGRDNEAGYSAHAEGRNNKALRDNTHAEGRNTIANAIEAHAEGFNTTANGRASHAEGWYTIANGEKSHAEGNHTQTNNDAEHACGILNKSTQSSDKSKATHFSIGIGTSDTDRKNAFEVKKNGDVYIKGIGGYDGTNPESSDDLATVLSKGITNVTHEELKTLRDNSQLVPGQQYRITDYITTTKQNNTQSAKHQFDIIVTADDVNVLNENARAIQHKGDTYFKNSDLNAWELKYCLDNDTSRFAWAVTSGKGVIYYMKDEFSNECPYDFKNIQFARWQLSNPVGYRNDYDFDNWEDNWIRESTPFDSLKTGFYGLNGSDNVFYYAYNESYDCYKYRVEYTISSQPTYCYTFGNGTDYSISGSNYGNVIKEYKNGKKIQLNNIVFLSNNCYYNSFGDNCYNNSFDNSCNYNSFGNSCNSNSFGNGCNYNSFGDSCTSNSFGNYCDYNSFGNNCYNNIFGNSYYSNSFGNNCYSNSFGDYCTSNSFGNDCNSNSFGNRCNSNSFGNDCYYNSFGESHNNLKSYYRYIIFDNGNRSINLNCTTTTSSSKYFQNVRIGLGVNNTTTYKTINDSNVGQTYQTVYKPTDSKDLTV